MRTVLVLQFEITLTPGAEAADAKGLGERLAARLEESVILKPWEPQVRFTVTQQELKLI